MTEPAPAPLVERLFPFVLRSGILLVGRDAVGRRRGRLHFVLITRDLSTGSRGEILKNFARYPVIERYTSADLETHFKVRGARVIGFLKSALAQSLYRELKPYQVNQPEVVRAPTAPRPTAPPASRPRPKETPDRGPDAPRGRRAPQRWKAHGRGSPPRNRG